MSARLATARPAMVVVAAAVLAAAVTASAGAVAQDPMPSRERSPQIRFEANVGQTAAEVSFVARCPGYTLFLTGRGAVLALAGPPADPGSSATAGPRRVVRMTFAGGRLDPPLDGLDPLPGKVNYFRGNDPRKWRTGVPTYARVAYRGVYPGIDVVFYGNDRGDLEHDFIVAPGARVDEIALRFEGIERVADDGGDLRLVVDAARGEEVRLHRPVIRPARDGDRPRRAGYRACGDEVRLWVEPYAPGEGLVIDPVLTYGTYLGGSDVDDGTAIAVDPEGYAYVAGYTLSVDFPAEGPIQTDGGDRDAFVTKIDPTGSALVYSTYLGGSGLDSAFGIAIDDLGQAHVTGSTRSPDFPVQRAWQAGYAGAQDAFAAKLGVDGAALIYSTYLGGKDSERCFAVAVGPDGSAYVAGGTESPDFPTVNALQPALAGAQEDVFITRLDPAGGPVFSTYLGGLSVDAAASIAVGPTGDAYVTGFTSAGDTFPIRNAFQPANAGGQRDAFVARLDGSGLDLVYSTYLGGSDGDYGGGIAVDATGAAYVAGGTASADFPTRDAIQPALDGSTNAYLAKLRPDGSALAYSTYLGGSDGALGNKVVVDGLGRAIMAGFAGDDFPVTHTFGSGGGGDAFVAMFDPAGTSLVYSATVGGSGTELGNNLNIAGAGIAATSCGIAYITGDTPGDFPTTAGAYSRRLGGFRDAFVARIGVAEAICPPDVFRQCPAGPTDPVVTGEPTAAGFCSTATCRFEDQVFDGCGETETIRRTWTCTEGIESARCIQTIREADTLPPEASGIERVLAAACDAVPPPVEPVVTDACDPAPTVEYREGRIDGSCPDAYTLVRNWITSDACGNRRFNLQDVNVEDAAGPVLLDLPLDVTVECDAVPATRVVTAVDGCDPAPVVEYSETRTDGPCPDSYTLTRTWTARDRCGNETTGTQVVTVRDTTAPAILGVPPDATVECDAVPPPAEPTAHDGCDPGPSLAFRETRVDGHCPGNYTLLRTWTASDRCGNEAAATQVVTVEDTTPPVVTAGAGDDRCLWPPNHWYVCFGREDFHPRVADNCSEPATWTFAGCASDQPDDAPEDGANGDGHTTNDCVVLPQGEGFCVRAERLAREPGAGDGRRYQVTAAGVDACGNRSAPAAAGAIDVPHDGAAHRGCLVTTGVGCRPLEAVPCPLRGGR